MAMSSQPRWLSLQTNSVLWFGYFLVVVGMVFVVSSSWALGFYGTFLGTNGYFFISLFFIYHHQNGIA